MTDDLKVLIGELKGRMDARMDAQDKRLDDILEQTKKTNGRVTSIETDRAIEKGANQARLEAKVERADRGRRIEWWFGTLIALVGVVGGVIGTIVATT